jgi:Tfp pilus assembly PilM family ATPase
MARILGLDISPNALRATLIQTSFRKVSVERYAQIPLTVSEPGAPRRAELGEAMRGLLQVLGTVPDSVVTSLPGELVSLRTLELPLTVQKRITDVLPMELEALLPVPAEQTVVDWQPIRTGATTVSVMAASVLRERVAAELEELHAASIDPRELAAGACALDGLSRLLPDLKTSPCAVIDVDDARTDICIFDAGKCTFARTLTIGLDALPRRSEELSRALRQSIAAHRASGGPELLRVLVAGPGALATGVADWIGAQLGVPSETIALPAAPSVDFERPLFARATALAARAITSERRINLRTGPFAMTRSASPLRDHMGLLATCGAAVILSLAFSVQARRSLLTEERDALEAELTQKTTELFGKPITDKLSLEALLKNPRAGDPLPHFDAYDTLGAVSTAIPSEIKHDMRRVRIEIGDDKREGHVEIQGMLSSIEQRDAVAAHLEQNECFHDIERGRTTPARDSSINYQLEAVIRCSGDPGPKKGKKPSAQ